MSSGTAAAFGVASVLTVIVAWPVVVAPAQQIFGHEIVGRHHDPFTVMYQIAGSGPVAPYIQPLTDGTGWLLARVLGPVVAYNVLILMTFPLTAAATYALARYLRLTHAAALAAGLLFAFAPPHVAHAAYHPHVAQTQWLPLYLLALFALIDRPTAWRGAALAATGAALVLSNFYMGLIGAVMTPVALVAYWSVSPRAPRRFRHLLMSAAWLSGLAGLGVAAVAMAVPQVLRDPSAYGFAAEEVSLYSAHWWAYLTPPVTHAALGPASIDVFTRAGVSFAALEQQIYVGYAPLALALVAGVSVFRSWHVARDRRYALALWALAAVAFVVSLGPLGSSCGEAWWAPACQLHAIAPMFRAYARFAFVVSLAVALAAGAGLALLTRRSSSGRAMAAALLIAAVFEYWPLPPQARDVLPTAGHRWLTGQGPDVRTLDCVPPDAALGRVAWLMRQHVGFLDAVVPTCRDTALGRRMVELGYTHVLIRERDRADAARLLDTPGSGLVPVATFPDSQVFAVIPPTPHPDGR